MGSFSTNQRKWVRPPWLLNVFLNPTQYTQGHFKLGILFFLLWGMNWYYFCRKPLSRHFTFWSTFEEQHNLLSMTTLACYLSHSAAHSSLMVCSYSCFSPGVTLTSIQGRRWSSSLVTRACVSHLSQFLGIFMELCFVFPLPYVSSLLFSY